MNFKRLVVIIAAALAAAALSAPAAMAATRVPASSPPAATRSSMNSPQDQSLYCNALEIAIGNDESSLQAALAALEEAETYDVGIAQALENLNTAEEVLDEAEATYNANCQGLT